MTTGTRNRVLIQAVALVIGWGCVICLALERTDAAPAPLLAGAAAVSFVLGTLSVVAVTRRERFGKDAAGRAVYQSVQFFCVIMAVTFVAFVSGLYRMLQATPEMRNDWLALGMLAVIYAGAAVALGWSVLRWHKGGTKEG